MQGAARSSRRIGRSAVLLAAGVVIGIVITGTALAAAIGASGIASNAIRAKHIKNGEVRSADIATGGVRSIDIAAGQVTRSDLAAGAVDSAKLAANAVSAAEITADAVGASELATDSVGALEVAPGAIGTGEIADGAIGTVDLADASVTGGKLGAPIGTVIPIVAQAVPNMDPTVADLGVTEFDSDTFHVSGTDVVTISSSGLYQVCINLSWSSISTDGIREFAVLRNSIPFAAAVADAEQDLTSIPATYQSTCRVATLDASDQFTIELFQTSVGSLNTNGGSFSIMRLGASS